MTKPKVLRLIGWMMVFLVIIFSLVRLPQASNPIAGTDKLLHFTCYFFLTYWFLHVYLKQTVRIVLGLAAMGTLLELFQSLTGYRFMEWLDMVMNLIGVFTAVLLFFKSNIRVKYLVAD